MKLHFYLCIFLWCTCLLPCSKNNSEAQKVQKISDPFYQQRLGMVQQQIIARGVKDRNVLRAMRSVPRHEFVPAAYQSYAYHDSPLPIGHEQTISQPYIVALMTAQLQPKRTDCVLEIGTGSGYQAAVLAELVDTVYTIEIIPELAKQAEQTLSRLGYKNIRYKVGDGYRGWPEKAPFNGIIVTAAPDHIPQPLIDQLAPDGRLIIPVGDWFQELMLISKDQKGRIHKNKILPVRFVPMTGEAQKSIK